MTDSTSRLARVAAIILRLKRTNRTGWLDRGVPPLYVESVADHSHAMSTLAWLLALGDPRLNPDRVLQLGIVHDLAEAITGDLPPYRAEDIPAEHDPTREAFFRVRRDRPRDMEIAKRSAEADAFAEIVGLLPASAKASLSALWREYTERSTPEARFVKQVDILESFLESRALAQQFPDLPLTGFTDMAMNELTEPLLIAIRDEVLATSNWPDTSTKAMF